MTAGACLAVALCALLVTLSGPAAAQADAHARALARAACQSGKQSEAVTDAAAVQERDPNELGPRMRLADALVDQGCYQEAVDVLEAGQQAFPRNRELSAKLRDVRSLVTEQTYIEGLTQAAEGAKFQRNQLRCTRLADATACDDALKSKPDDEQLLLAKGDALMQGNRPADAVVAYRHASQLKPGDDAVKTKLAAAEALVASTTQAAEAASQVAAADSAAGQKAPKRTPAASTGASAGTPANASTVANAGSASRARPTSGKNAGAGAAATLAAEGTPARSPPALATLAALGPQEARTYSNDAPPGRTN
jgi:cytochrome c-type biogenesis protein CcmH/NrfG